MARHELSCGARNCCFTLLRMRLTWPLMGREKEMRLIDAALSEPDVSGIVISGAAGVGKSRIATEALDAAAARGCVVRRVVGTSSARKLPLGALASWAGPTGRDGLQLVWSVIESLSSAADSAAVAPSLPAHRPGGVQPVRSRTDPRRLRQRDREPDLRRPG